MLKRCIACFAVHLLALGLFTAVPAPAQEEQEVVEEVPVEEAPAEEAPAEEAPVDEHAVEEIPVQEVPESGTSTRRPSSGTSTRPPSGTTTTRPRVNRPQPLTPPAARPQPPQVPGGAKLADTPAAPALPPGATPDEDALFNFNDQPLIQVIQHIAMLTGKNFDIDPNIGATTVTIITHDKFPPEMAYEVLESVLNSRGYSLVENLDGKLIQVIPTPDAPGSGKTGIQEGITADNIPEGYDTFSTHVVPIKYADPAEISTALTLLGTKNAKVDTYQPTSTLIITDTANGLRRMLKFIELADIPGNDTTMDIFTLEYTRAEVVATQLEQVLLAPEGAGAAQNTSRTTTTRPQSATTRPTRPTTRTVPGAEASAVIGSNEEVLRMVPDERLNSLIVVATEGMMEQVRDLVKRLDTPVPYEQNNMHIYELLNADAELMEQALQPLIGTAPRRQEGGGGGGAAAAAGGAGGGGGSSGSSEVQPFEQKVQIARYDQTNSLLILASPQDYKQLEAYIARLDVPQRQVYVKASVMDVALNDTFNLQVNAASISGSDGFGLTDTSLLPVTDLATALTNPTGAGAGLLSSVLSLGDSGGISAGIFDDITVEYGGREFNIPFVPVLFQALETLSDLEVLSQPSLTTIDNEESSITVGKEVPFITGSSRPQTTTGGTDGEINSSFGTTRIEREDVGVKLKVTPQISEGDNVLLETEIEVSDIADTDPRVGTPDIVGPTTNKSLFTSKVLVKDGSTAVLAGLIRDSTNRTRNQAPLLGDAPVLGWLFRSKKDTRQKSNLVVLVTPHIVKENVDMERLTLHKLNEYHDANLDELFEAGFFKKVKKKQEYRKSHRPTFDESAAITGRDTGSGASDSFRRGDMKR
ncbi:MAG: type II secretion system secretin GspD [Candidatus Hydrogenedentes bacterium]|nr:type II secretion system secretin GspD [Candidatus Hydrogenedentota bacterium]